MREDNTCSECIIHMISTPVVCDQSHPVPLDVMQAKLLWLKKTRIQSPHEDQTITYQCLALANLSSNTTPDNVDKSFILTSLS